MSNDGPARRKQRIDAISDYIRESGQSGRTIRKCLVWADRLHGLTPATARSYIDTLLEYGEIVLAQSDQRLRHIDIFPKKTGPSIIAPPQKNPNKNMGSSP